ncbi:uncharacterized protein [Musca autumnalis]|uniref:uncharacterized protein n=1 Tax=Musca autumnalis TaxID=221902 RepID=UPI003CE6BD5C
MELTQQKKSRCARASAAQHAALLTFLEAEKGLAEGKYVAMHGKEMARKKWQTIGEELNKIPGAVKTAEQWQTVWRDLKSKSSTKFKTLKRERAATGNMPLSQGLLTPIEERVVGLVGWEYMMGNESCPDSLEIEIANDLNAFLDDTTKTPEEEVGMCAVEIEALDEDFEMPDSYNAAKPSKPSKVAKTMEKTTPLKRQKKDNGNREEFLNIAKTQADAMLLSLKNYTLFHNTKH